MCSSDLNAKKSVWNTYTLKSNDIIFFRGDNNDCKINIYIEYEKGYSVNNELPNFPEYWPLGFVNTEYCQGTYSETNIGDSKEINNNLICGNIYNKIYKKKQQDKTLLLEEKNTYENNYRNHSLIMDKMRVELNKIKHLKNVNDVVDLANKLKITNSKDYIFQVKEQVRKIINASDNIGNKFNLSEGLETNCLMNMNNILMNYNVFENLGATSINWQCEGLKTQLKLEELYNRKLILEKDQLSTKKKTLVEAKETFESINANQRMMNQPFNRIGTRGVRNIILPDEFQNVDIVEWDNIIGRFDANCLQTYNSFLKRHYSSCSEYDVYESRCKYNSPVNFTSINISNLNDFHTTYGRFI